MKVYPVREPRDIRGRTRKEEILPKSLSMQLKRKQSARGAFSSGVTSRSPKETKQFVTEALKKLKPNKIGATVLALSGNLGSGKTTFTQNLARLLKIKETVNSPTYVIMKTYNIQPTTNNKKVLRSKSSVVSRWSHLVHIDAYRLEKFKELEHLGWEELISEPSNLIVVEWAEKVRGILPKSANWVYFEFVNDTTRKIELGSKK